MIMNKTKENKKWTQDKIEQQQHIYMLQENNTRKYLQY